MKTLINSTTEYCDWCKQPTKLSNAIIKTVKDNHYECHCKKCNERIENKSNVAKPKSEWTYKKTRKQGDNYNVGVKLENHYEKWREEIVANVNGKANAKLIAAAPALLEALKLVECTLLKQFPQAICVVDVKQAINKATK